MSLMSALKFSVMLRIAALGASPRWSSSRSLEDGKNSALGSRLLEGLCFTFLVTFSVFSIYLKLCLQ